MLQKYCLKDESFKAHRGYEALSEIEKLFDDKEIRLISARNQEAALQLLIYSETGYTLSVDGNTFFNEKGIAEALRVSAFLESKEQSFEILMHIEEFIPDDDGMLKADILSEHASLWTDAGMLAAVWIEIKVPKAAIPGIYKGKINIFHHYGFEPEKTVGELAFSLDIKEFCMPDPTEYSFYLDLWQHNSNIARKHEVALWSKAHFDIIENYVKSIAALGQKAITAIVSEVPWSGQFCFRDSLYPSNLFEFNMVRIIRDKTGSLKYDFSALSEYISLCMKYGIDKEIEVIGLINIWVDVKAGFGAVAEDYPDSIRLRYLDESDMCYKYTDKANDIEGYIKALETYFIEQGLISIVRVTADEPSDVAVFRKRFKELKRIAPAFKYKAAINHAEFIEEFIDEIDDFVPVFPIVISDLTKFRMLKSKIKGRLLWYVCCYPDIPNTFIRSHLTESYLIFLLSIYMGFDGFLRWNYTVWPDDPRKKISYKPIHWKAGDTNFVYPSPKGAPVLSLRYKALRRGAQWHEIACALKQKDPERFEQIMQETYQKIFRFDDITEFHPNVRKHIEELVSLEYSDYYDWIRKILESI